MTNPTQGKRLYRSREGRLVAGVCAGLANYTGIDANLFRLLFAVMSLFAGTGVLLYMVGWVVIPEEGEPTSIAEGFINKNKR